MLDDIFPLFLNLRNFYEINFTDFHGENLHMFTSSIPRAHDAIFNLRWHPNPHIDALHKFVFLAIIRQWIGLKICMTPHLLGNFISYNVISKFSRPGQDLILKIGLIHNSESKWQLSHFNRNWCALQTANRQCPRVSSFNIHKYIIIKTYNLNYFTFL